MFLYINSVILFLSGCFVSPVDVAVGV
jgi:hypothetical protein